MSSLKGKNVLVLGLGLSGTSAVRFLLKRGAHVTGVDQSDKTLQALKETFPEVALFLDTAKIDFASIDLVVVSPGISPKHPLYQKAKLASIEIIGEVELACREISKPCLGVTGTNGKTTVSLLTTHVLNQAGKKAVCLGNVGVPLTSALDTIEQQESEIYVIELSSFQLETLTHPFLDSGVILNITPDHLDRYESMTDYAKAKIKLYEIMKPNGKLFVEDKCLEAYPALFKGKAIFSYGYRSTCAVSSDTLNLYYFGKRVSDLPESLKGKKSHDLENAMAAFALCQEMQVTQEQFWEAFSTFKKPSHRIEFVRSLHGVRYYDDSKGTNIDAVVRAVDSIEGEIVLIAGGVDKGFPYEPWLAPFKGRVKAVCAIGQSAEKIKGDIGSHIPVEIFASLQEAVANAAKLAKKGEAVLLSPGCSSFDMFKDYSHRGNEFQRFVKELI